MPYERPKETTPIPPVRGAHAMGRDMNGRVIGAAPDAGAV